MKISYNIVGFRYRKGFIVNVLRRKKIQFNSNNFFTSHESCPICSADEYEIISEVDTIGMLNETVVCKQCDFVFNNSYIANPTEYYNNQFGAERWQDPEKSFLRRTSTHSFSVKRFEFIKKTIGEDFSRIEKILEIGCGDGCNLLPYHLIGKSVVGCDFNDNFLDPGRKRGMELIKGDIQTIPKTHKFDLIMLIHSFEHVIGLDEMVQQVNAHLNPGGFVFVEVPGIVNWNRTIKTKKSEMGLNSSNNFMGYLQFQHNYHFDLGHLKYIWERNSFEMVEGDEWVRAIFKREDMNNSDNKDLQPTWSMLNQNIVQHLKEVEEDFLSMSNLARGLMKLIYSKFF
jgi:2-polyprenyl-3-methyl-5-hydroxy-6-metoxy-1,4-benzoquinol methylase